ncbi:MAG: DUF6477 family protein [Pseudomonadota bacterium]
MQKLKNTLTQLNRPRLLVGAARKGLMFYRRERDLARLLKRSSSATGTDAERLLQAEAKLEETRTAGDATYSVGTHIALLTALIAEATLITGPL